MLSACFSLQSNSPSPTLEKETNSYYEVVSTVTDRSDLSDEMASLNLCQAAHLSRQGVNVPA